MSRSLLFLSIFLCFTASLCADLNCNGVKFIEGDPNFSNISEYFPTTIKQINEQNLLDGPLELWESGESIATGQITVSTVVDLDFSDGDQYSNYIFETKDWVSFWKTNQKSLSGYYVDSFSWADGDHTRAKFLINCERSALVVN